MLIEILTLMLLLNLKHWYADFGIQTYDQTVRKGIYGDLIGITHSLDHARWTMVVLLIFSISYHLSPEIILAMSLLESFIHYHIDWVKIRFGSKDMSTSRFWNEFGLDQFAHQLTYLAMIYAIFEYK